MYYGLIFLNQEITIDILKQVAAFDALFILCERQVSCSIFSELTEKKGELRICSLMLRKLHNYTYNSNSAL